MLSNEVILIPARIHTSLKSLKSISTLLINIPDTPFTPLLFKIRNISLSSIVSVTTTHGISVTFTTEFRSRRCMNTISGLYCSIKCCCLKSVSKSFKDTAIFSFPKRKETSLIKSMETFFEKFNIARFTPA